MNSKERTKKMKKAKVLLTVLLVFVMVFSMAACGGNGGGDQGGDTVEEKPMVVGYSNFSSKFSPFFAESAYDVDVSNMTQISLLTTDRLGNVIMNGIEGETAEYNGTEYTYTGPADLVMTENPDGTVFYDFTIRDDMVFSDGTPVTIDDVIFTMYVLCDPTYDGSSTLYAVPIEGMEAYRSGMDTMLNLIIAAGPENTNFDNWTEDQQKAYWDAAEAAPVAIAQEICDYLVEAGANEEGDIAGCAANWGFSLPEGATIDDFAATMMEAYGNNIVDLVGTEAVSSVIEDFLPNVEDYSIGIKTGESAPNISGIQKTGDYSMRIVATQVDAPAIYNLGVNICPLHYYGDASKYDYDNNMFGFEKGDLSSVRAKTTEPMGAGPYKFVEYSDGIVYFEANESYFKGAPKTNAIQFREMSDDDKLNGVIAGTVDITDPSFSKEKAKTITEANSNGELTGETITTDLVDNLGYGYIGINSVNVSVGGDPASDASKNLRKAFATIFSVHRDVAIDSYYGDTAEVINYPISNTSWAAPQPTDDDYRVAFSVDVDGNEIYTSDMSADDKIAAAKTAALGFFEAAGYTVTDGKVTAAPEGAKLEYEAMIPADGIGDHPAFAILDGARRDLEELGINLIVNDLSNSSDLWDALDAVSAEIWCAAWQATIDPDMYQIYYSDAANGPGGGRNPFGGPAQGGSNGHYCIADESLDEMIMEARTSTDQSFRKAMYKACLDTIIDWACEVPTYQRQNCVIFSTERVNVDTITPDITPFYGWMAEIENTEMN